VSIASGIPFLVVVAYLTIFNFLVRYAAAKWSDRPVGQALSYLYG
jgi:hypothetical protein